MRHEKGTSITLKIVKSSKQGYESASYLEGATAGAPVACSGAALSTYSEFGVLSSTCSAQKHEVLAGMACLRMFTGFGSCVLLTINFWRCQCMQAGVCMQHKTVSRGLAMPSCGLRPSAGAVLRKCTYLL